MENNIVNKRRKLGLTDDLVFKAVYGSDSERNKKALIALLNLVLDRQEDPITNLVYKNPFVLPASPYETKEIIMDIKVQTSKKELIDIEMQVGAAKDYKERAVFYQAGLLNEELKRGENYDKISKTIMISLIHHNTLFPNIPDYHTCFRYKDILHGEELSSSSEIHFLEFSKIIAKPISEMDSLERLCAYIKYSADVSMEGYLAELVETGEEAIILTEPILREVTEDERLRAEQFSREWFKRDQEFGLRKAKEQGEAEGRAEGMAKGMAEGLAKGKAEAKVEVAKAMKAKGFDAATIAEITNLSTDEISKL